MAVFRVEKNSGYTVMSNHHLRNRALSLKAKGLLSYNKIVVYATFRARRTLPGLSGAAWATPCYSVSVCSRPAASASPYSVPIEKGAFEWRM